MQAQVDGRLKVQLPAGELGLSFQADAPIVTAVAPDGGAAKLVAVGWRLLTVGVGDVSKCTGDEIAKMLAENAHSERELFFALPERPPILGNGMGSFSVHAPAGWLGLRFADAPGSGTRWDAMTMIQNVAPASPLYASVRAEMRVVAIDSIDVSKRGCNEVAAMFKERAGNAERVLVFALPPEEDSPWPMRIAIAIVLALILGLAAFGWKMFTGNLERERLQAVMQKAQAVAQALAKKGFRHDFLSKVVFPAMKLP